MKKFNDPELLDTAMSFVIDSFYVFNTSVSEELLKDWSGYDYRFVYDAFSDDEYVNWDWEIKTVSQPSVNEDSLFTATSIDGLAWALGMARGCISTNWMKVSAANNPINSQAYIGQTSIMNSPTTNFK